MHKGPVVAAALALALLTGCTARDEGDSAASQSAPATQSTTVDDDSTTRV